MTDWDVDMNWDSNMDWTQPQQKTEIETEIKEKSKHQCGVRCTILQLPEKYLYRRAYGESKLLDALNKEGFKYEYGKSYHFISGGDVDALTYLKTILRQQELEYCLASTWCMSAYDIKQIQDWVINGKIKKLDVYVGEIFPGSFKVEYNMLKEFYNTNAHVGRVACFKNHSKVFCGWGDKFPFVIESSANINTNPRTEQTCITIDDGLMKFYKDFYDSIESFDK